MTRSLEFCFIVRVISRAFDFFAVKMLQASKTYVLESELRRTRLL